MLANCSYCEASGASYSPMRYENHHEQDNIMINIIGPGKVEINEWTTSGRIKFQGPGCDVLEGR